jgi:putative glutamine transport system substrate-binding protein
MKRVIFHQLISTIILSVALYSTSMAQPKGDTYASAKESKKATWSLLYSDSPGLATINGGKPEGLCFDLMVEFASYVKTKSGIEVSLKYPTEEANDFDLYLKNVKDGKGGVFGLSNTTITAERKKSYKFSPPFMKNVSMLLSNSSVTQLNDLNTITTTFAQLKGITVKGTINEGRILALKKKYFPAMEIESVSSFSEAIDRISTDSKTFTCTDVTYFMKAIQAGKKIKRHPAGDEEGEEFGVLMPLSNDWSPLFTEFMNSGFSTSEKYHNIMVKHLGQSILKFSKTK